MSVFHRGRLGRKPGETAAIFVHAGAGYHSIQNESIHLQACNDAATAAMAVLRNGGTAVEAVEIAIKVLEDREITNAGYGSNLAIDGTVEGDAVVVDHYGRSGAVGALAQIKNPISAARLVLDMSTQELTLRRVPPNLLVSQGATDFAHIQGMAVLPNDALVSQSAKERWNRWKTDLDNAETKAKKRARAGPMPSGSDSPMTATQPTEPPPDYEELVRKEVKREHDKAVKASVWNEGQPVSPPSSAGVREHQGISSASRNSSADSRFGSLTPLTPGTDNDDQNQNSPVPLTEDNLARNARVRDSPGRFLTIPTRRATDAQDAARDTEAGLSGIQEADDEDYIDDGDAATLGRFPQPPSGDIWRENSTEDIDDDDTSGSSTLHLPSSTPSPPTISDDDIIMADVPETSAAAQVMEGTNSIEALDHEPFLMPPHPQVYQADNRSADREDCVTDTVGAIAIDSEGNIACGASSGGIGMKFRGRIGPAALVGVGAAVAPVDAEDKTRTCTAAVTSGTGEHMATTLAASVCAERLYHNQKKRKGGGFEHCEDDQAVRAMIENDFMDHPSVKHSHSTGAIGVLAVKKSVNGAYLYFAHNTDSFALASMHADEPKPTCTMSRSHGNGMVAAGGRSIRSHQIIDEDADTSSGPTTEPMPTVAEDLIDCHTELKLTPGPNTILDEAVMECDIKPIRAS